MSAHVTLTRRRMRSLRLSLAAVRLVLLVLALAGIAASVRDLLVARPSVRVPAPGASSGGELEAQWLALAFARAYLSFTPHAASRERALAAFLGPAAEHDAGATAVADERVASVEIVSVRDEGAERDYTVAARVSDGTFRYLVVPIVVAAGDAMLAHYPALAARPRLRRVSQLDSPGLPGLAPGAAATVVERALRNYLDGPGANLAADLAPGARTTAAEPGLRLIAVRRLALESGRDVLATVLAADRAGDRLTLDYRLGLRSLRGRWEVTSIEP